MLETIESFVYTHYLLRGTVVKGFKITPRPTGCPLYFFKIKGNDGKTYDINVPLFSANYQKLQSKIGSCITLKIEGYLKGSDERYILLDILSRGAEL